MVKGKFKIPLLLLLLIMCGIAASFIPKVKRAEIPGTIFFRPNLYMDAVPVDNIGYLEYFFSARLYYKDCLIDYADKLTSQIPIDGPKKYLVQHCYRGSDDSTLLPVQKLLPRFILEDNGSSVEVDLYLRHPAFNKYPMVSCSRQQAIDYCRWGTAMVKILFYISYNDVDRPIKAYNDIEYRLPYYSELQMFAYEYYEQGKFYKTPEVDTTDIPELTPYASKQKKRKASFSNIYEYTQSEDSIFYVKTQGSGLEFFSHMDTVAVGKRHTGFRCICEIK